MEAQQAILKSTIKAQHSIQLTLSVSTGVEVSHKTCICFICFVSLSESSFFSPTFTNLLKDTSKDGLPQWLHGKESFCNAGAACLIPGSRRSPGGRHGNALQYSCLENPMGSIAWWAIDHGVAKSWTQLKRLSTHAHMLKDTYEQPDKKVRSGRGPHAGISVLKLKALLTLHYWYIFINWSIAVL